MAKLSEIVEFCDQRTNHRKIRDYPGAYNGLQLENNGKVGKIGASVDAGLFPFRAASEAGVDFLICHHGMFWNPPIPIVETNYQKLKLAMDHNLAVYGCHIPLDGHAEIGNNALLARELGLNVTGSFLPYEGFPIATIAEGPDIGREALGDRLRTLFPTTFSAIEYGSEKPERVAILTGSGQSAVDKLRAEGIDTLITGELRQHHFNMAQELRLNLYPCGHYATETFAVRALAEEVAKKFDLDWCFLPQECTI